MEWQGGRRSDNVDDAGRGGGFGRPLAFGGGAVGIIGAILFYLLTGQVPDVQQAPAPSQVGPQRRPARRAAPTSRRSEVRVGGPRRHRGHLDRGAAPAGAHAVPAAPRWCSSRTRCSRRAASPRRRWGRSTARATSACTWTSASSTSSSPLRRARRLRARLRHRPRGRPPRAEPARHLEQQVQQLRRRAGSEEDANALSRAAGAAGGLLRRRLGPPRNAKQRARASSRAGDIEGRWPRRRPSATTGCRSSARPRGAGVLHPRLLCAARRLVQDRAAERRLRSCDTFGKAGVRL